MGTFFFVFLVRKSGRKTAPQLLDLGGVSNQGAHYIWCLRQVVTPTQVKLGHLGLVQESGQSPKVKVLTPTQFQLVEIPQLKRIP